MFVPAKEKLIVEKNKEFLLKEFRAAEVFVEKSAEESQDKKYSIKITPL